MKQANTKAVDAAINEAAARRDALALEMAKGREVAEQRMPEMTHLHRDLAAELPAQRVTLSPKDIDLTTENERDRDQH